MQMTFVHPPLDDPTLPYHSTAYLMGQLLHNGFQNVSTRDLNIEFVNYCLEEEVCREFKREIRRRLGDLSFRNHLTFLQQEQFYSLWASDLTDGVAVSEAVATLRDRRYFLDFERYQRSVDILRRHFHMIGTLSYPAEITDFMFRSCGRYSIYHLSDLFNEDLCSDICYPIEQFFYDRCVGDAELVSSQCIGVSLVYDHQLLPGLHLTRLIKNRWPEKTVLIGGTSISQSFKYLKDKSLLKRFFTICDGIVVGEGESAICEIADVQGDLTRAERVPNLITYDRGTDTLRLPTRIHYENVAALGPPVYKHRWESYLSPERGINYAPTRGCYWNRCTFCDYGLNTDKPTSPWRERPPALVVQDLQKICREEQVGYVYFAVDVMAPGYLERLSDAIVESGIKIRWSAELRLEKIFSKDRCRKLVDSGCVSVSFGMESGNQRVLDLIDKGTKVQYMGETMKNFAEAGIAVQIMAFTHFPTESDAERDETRRFLELNQEYWSSGGLGTFVLTGTALVAKNPAKFNLTLIEPQNADIVRALGFQTAQNQTQMVSAEESDSSFDKCGDLFPSVYGRPWAGGTDALHSMIYYSTHGRNVFKNHRVATVSGHHERRTKEQTLNSVLITQGKLAESNVDVAAALRLRGEHAQRIKALQQMAKETIYKEFVEWQKSIPGIERQPTKSFWIIRNGKCLKIDGKIYSILVRAKETNVTVEKLLKEYSSSFRERIVDHLIGLETRGYVALMEQPCCHSSSGRAYVQTHLTCSPFSETSPSTISDEGKGKRDVEEQTYRSRDDRSVEATGVRAQGGRCGAESRGIEAAPDGACRILT
jgi:anaerobic magnesium-protoporphyrin IX monomethyl ester cyclase